MSHPPIGHNPHVYQFAAPNVAVGSRPIPEPATVHSDVAVNTPDGPEAVDVEQSDEDANVDVDGDGQVTGYEVFTKADLITECEQRGLPTSGNKADLVRRLQEADAAKPAEGA